MIKLKLRQQRLLIAEHVKKSDKLLKIQVDLDSEQRQIVSGIAKFYTPDDIMVKK